MLGDGIRRNIALVDRIERDKFRDAILDLKRKRFFPDRYSYWDKQNQIHRIAHSGGLDIHYGYAFLPWHREMCNRFEALLRIADQDLSLHYWDWTQDPTHIETPNGVVNLFDPDFLGSAIGDVDKPLEDFESDEFRDGVADPNGVLHQWLWRNCHGGEPPSEEDNMIVFSADNEDKRIQYSVFNDRLQKSHNRSHDYIGGCIGNSEYSFHDPFVFLLHSNVDRLFARWQTRPDTSSQKFSWRLKSDEVYGDALSSLHLKDDVHPWTATKDPLVRPWAPPDNWHEKPPSDWPIQERFKKYIDQTIVNPPKYDTNGI
jgi:hypothetical protein